MMNIYEYLRNMTEEQYDEEDSKLWNLYEQEDDSFDRYCEKKGIDLTVTEMVGYVNKREVKVVTLWAWDHDDA